MTEIVRGNWFALGRTIKTLRSLVRIGSDPAIHDVQNAFYTPRILQEVRRLSRAGIRGERHLPDNSRKDAALRYSIRPQLIPSRTGSAGGINTAPPAVRFNVVDADEALLQFLGKPAAGFHVFELRCAGFERLWRDDLSKVVETRKPVLAKMNIYVGNEPVELVHLACPLLESGRIAEIDGWFDEARGKSIPTLEWAAVRHVRRSIRSHSVAISCR